MSVGSSSNQVNVLHYMTWGRLKGLEKNVWEGQNTLVLEGGNALWKVILAREKGGGA